jgi:hypothetical protein
MPGIFQACQIGAEHYVDGGVREIVPVRAAIQLGATEVVAIACSTQNLPRAGYAGARSFIDNMLSSLTNITLKEIVEDDLAGRGVAGVPVTVIIPNFDVHDTAVVDMGLIHVSMDYGYMRAADVMSAFSSPSARRAAFTLSDAIASMRAETHRMAQLWNRPLEAGSHRTLDVLRLRKWLIRKLVEARIASGIALPRFATLWFQLWEQGSSTEPNEPTPWAEFVTFAETTPAIAPYAYVPDGWTYEEAGDLDGRYLIRAGARFRGTAEAIAAVTGPSIQPVLTVPAGTSRHLPSVPVAGTVLAEVSIKNTGSKNADLTALTITGEQPAGQFALPEFGIERMLAPGQQSSVSVAYMPATRGQARATFAVDMSSATDQPSVTYRRRYEVPLSASARMPTLFLAAGPRLNPVPLRFPLEPDPPVLVGPLAPRPLRPANREAELTRLDFGLGPVGETVLKSLWIRNIGDDVLTVGIPQPTELSRLSVGNLASFPATLAPGGEMEVPLQYTTGYVPGRRSESDLHIYSDDPVRNDVVLRVAIQAEGPHLAEPPEVIDLGIAAAGDGTVVRFTSDGSQPVSVSEVRLAGGRDFSLSGVPPLPTQVAPGSELMLAVTLAATAGGPYQDQLIVHHDGNPARASSILIRATIG